MCVPSPIINRSSARVTHLPLTEASLPAVQFDQMFKLTLHFSLAVLTPNYS
jgi:hypothetical protein